MKKNILIIVIAISLTLISILSQLLNKPDINSTYNDMSCNFTAASPSKVLTNEPIHESSKSDSTYVLPEFMGPQTMPYTVDISNNNLIPIH